MQVDEVDKELAQMRGFGKRMQAQHNLTTKRALELKCKVKDRVLDLWKEFQSRISKNGYDMDTLLQSLQFYAEDELFADCETDIEILEKVIINGSNKNGAGFNHKDNSPGYYSNSDSKSSHFSIKKGVRMSIFTIAEEDEHTENGGYGEEGSSLGE